MRKGKALIQILQNIPITYVWRLPSLVCEHTSYAAWCFSVTCFYNISLPRAWLINGIESLICPLFCFLACWLIFFLCFYDLLEWYIIKNIYIWECRWNGNADRTSDRRTLNTCCKTATKDCFLFQITHSCWNLKKSSLSADDLDISLAFWEICLFVFGLKVGWENWYHSHAGT